MNKIKGRKYDARNIITMMILISIFSLIILHITSQYRYYVLNGNTRLFFAGYSIDIEYWFDLDDERKFGAAFSAILLSFSGALMAFASICSSRDKVISIGWLFSAFILFYMASDEYFVLHERYAVRFGFERDFGSSLVPTWIKIMAVVTLIVIVLLSYFWWRLPTAIRWRLAIAVIVFISGAVGVEVISSAHVMQHGSLNFHYKLLNALEEGLEMVGILIVVDTMLFYVLRA